MIVVGAKELAEVYGRAYAAHVTIGEPESLAARSAGQALHGFIYAVGEVAGEPPHIGDPTVIGLMGDPFCPRVEL